MWETIAKIIPPPLLVGVLIYGGVCFLWLQPLIEQRMSEITYIPQCKAGKLPAVSLPLPPAKISGQTVPNGLSVPNMPRIEVPVSVQIIAELRGLFRNANGQRRSSSHASGSPCTCSVSTAFDGVFWRSLIHVMSLRTYTPRAIEHFDRRIAKILASGVCGKRT